VIIVILILSGRIVSYQDKMYLAKAISKLFELSTLEALEQLIYPRSSYLL
jgi:hypothetical protein